PTAQEIIWNTDPVANTRGVADRKGAGPSLSWFDMNPAVKAGCDQVSLGPNGNGMGGSVTNPTMLNVLCPEFGYRTGGIGAPEDLIAQRVGTRLAGTNFVRAAGHHQFMYGWDF